jgi:hypothetical protein
MCCRNHNNEAPKPEFGCYDREREWEREVFHKLFILLFLKKLQYTIGPTGENIFESILVLRDARNLSVWNNTGRSRI